MLQPVDRTLIDGRGGGGGRYSGLTVAEVQSRFAICRADPSMRSVSAVLRITREQMEARRPLQEGKRVMIILGALALVVAAGAAFLPPEGRLRGFGLAGVLVAFVLLQLYFYWTSREERRIAIAQEQEIVRMAKESLAELLTHSFAIKPLTREQADTLRHLQRQNADSRLNRLWEASEA